MAAQTVKANRTKLDIRWRRSPLIFLTTASIWSIGLPNSLQAVMQAELEVSDCLPQFIDAMAAITANCDRANKEQRGASVRSQESGVRRVLEPEDSLLMSDATGVTRIKSNIETTDVFELPSEHFSSRQLHSLETLIEAMPSTVLAETLVDATNLDLAPQLVEESPVLQRWLEEVPDIDHSINHDPAFRTQVRIGYTEFPSTNHTHGIYVGVQDLFVGQTPLTFSAEYAANGRGDRSLIGADAQYYLLPLGWYANVAPVVGYRAIDTPDFSTEGVNLGVRLILVPSRNGAADLSVTQSWVAPGSSDEISLTKFTVGYAVTRDFRFATDFQWQSTPARNESRVSILLEWMP